MSGVPVADCGCCVRLNSSRENRSRSHLQESRCSHRRGSSAPPARRYGFGELVSVARCGGDVGEGESVGAVLLSRAAEIDNGKNYRNGGFKE